MVRLIGAAAMALPLWVLTITQINAHGVTHSREYLIINSLLTAALFYFATTKSKDM